MRFFKIGFLLILISHCCCAQHNGYQFSQLDITNGLSNNQVHCIYKDVEGFMWFGTTSGLSRYDGYEFKNLKFDKDYSNSLINNYVVNIYEGPDKKMWVQTHGGFSVYDPDNERFDNNIPSELKRYHILAGELTSIKKDISGLFWFIIKGKGVYCYDPLFKTTLHYGTYPQSATTLHSNYIADVVSCQKGWIWIIYNDGVIEKVDTRANKVVLSTFCLFKENRGKEEIYNAIFDNNQNLWIYTPLNAKGVYCYNTRSDKINHLVKDRPGISLNSNIVNAIVQGDDQTIWIGTDHGGINLVDLNSHKISYLLHKDDDPKSLLGNSIVLYKDNTGIIWAGTFKQGISYFQNQIIQFPLIKHRLLDNLSLPYNDINSFTEDKAGNLWIGTNGGGLIFYNRHTGKYTQYKHDNANPNSLSNDVIVSLCIDHNNKLWIGTYYGGLDRMDNGSFTHYRHKDNDPDSITDDRVYSIFEDSSLKLWIGTFAGGVNIYNRKLNNFQHPHYPMLSDYTSVIYEDSKNNIWIGGDKGIAVIQHNTGLVKHYFNQQKNNNSLVYNDVNSIFEDHNGLFWIGTKEGLSILNTQTGIFTNLEEKQGLPSNNIWCVLEDNSGRIWASSANGIVSIKLVKNGAAYRFEIHRYNQFDGLQGSEFNAYAALKTKNGDLIFGGPNGFNIFNPDQIDPAMLKPKLLFTDFEIFNKSVKAGDKVDGEIILNRSIRLTRSLTLKHDQNAISIKFVACNYFNPNTIVYQYKLEGFDKDWISSPNTSRKAIYTNLDAGNYVFKVKAANTNRIDNASLITLNIKILPPFWKSTLAYLLYFSAFMGALFYVRKRGIQKIKSEFEAKQQKVEAQLKLTKEREEAQRMHELDLMKIKFFTNVSHEFRTPLSLIISPIDMLVKNNEKALQRDQLIMIQRNGRRLQNLVNQLLDFRKMEFKELKLDLRTGDIIQFTRDVFASFTDLADQKGIDYVFSNEPDSLITKFDHDKIERILFNLLSNAFKFTEAPGCISVYLKQLDSNTTEANESILELRVTDTGIGIDNEKQKKIFEPFFQADLPVGWLNQGSGIGLAISFEFVKMHNGEIYVESEPGEGSSFIVRLPLQIVNDKMTYEPVYKAANGIASRKKAEPYDTKKPMVLLIEDNDDLRFYLKDNLKYTFNIIEAANGKEGWQKALAQHPDLIVSDVSMPEMNGWDLCKKIRSDSRTAHIPVIILTALADEKDQLVGLANGANDYITKPFNFEILLSKIKGLLSMQQRFKKTYQKQMEIQVQDMAIVSEDEKFLKTVFECINKNITNPNFSVEELSREMYLSRVSLYKRLLALTGKTPVDCIRTVRLKMAVQLLEKSKLSIAHVAYEVGFNNPTYFSKVFKNEYGTVPSEYVSSFLKKKNEV